MSDIFVSGALPDERPIEAKLKDFKFDEIVASAAPVTWVEKPQSQWRKFPIFNQNGSGSCVAQTEAKELGIMRYLKDGVYVHFSATDIYQRRLNKPSAGMWAEDARNIIRNGGATLEVLAPSQSMTDAQMDAYKVEPYKRQVGDIFKVPNYLALSSGDEEKIGSVIQTTGKGVMIWFYFKIDEWTEAPVVKYPSLTVDSPDVLRHSVCGVEVTLRSGVKGIVIDDSWGSSFGLIGQRFISQDFLRARNYHTSYLMNFQFDGTVVPKPRYTFTRDLRFSEIVTTDPDVKVLQDILKYEGLFPTNTESTGYYGAITAKGVLSWQKKYKIASDAELDALGGKVCGPKTRAKLNEIYGS